MPRKDITMAAAGPFTTRRLRVRLGVSPALLGVSPALLGVSPALLGFLLALALLRTPVYAGDHTGVGLVILKESGEVVTRCVESGGDELSGADVLVRSGLDVVIDTGSGMGVIVCQIEGEGCAFPGEACFCQCMGGEECSYWNYFYRDPGQSDWLYSVFGAGVRTVKPGSVEAWVWGDGKAPPSGALTYEMICSQPTPTAEATLEPATPSHTPVPIVAAPSATTSATTPLPTAVAAVTAAPVSSPTTAPTLASAATQVIAGSPARADAPQTSYWLFALMVLGLAAIGAVVWARRTRVP